MSFTDPIPFAAGAGAYETEVLAWLDFVRHIRTRMRDFPELNTLIDGEEHSDQYILDAIGEVLSVMNTTPPPIGQMLVSNSPRHLLVDGTISILLESAAILLFRNEIGFSSGGFTVQLSQHHNYLQMSQMFRNRFENKLKEHKVAVNHQQGVDGSGGVASDWAILNRPLRYYLSEVFDGTLSSFYF